MHARGVMHVYNLTTFCVFAKSVWAPIFVWLVHVNVSWRNGRHTCMSCKVIYNASHGSHNTVDHTKNCRGLAALGINQDMDVIVLSSTAKWKIARNYTSIVWVWGQVCFCILVAERSDLILHWNIITSIIKWLLHCRTLYDGEEQEDFLQSLSNRIKNHDKDIERMCNKNYQGFIESVSELHNVKSDAVKLKVSDN